jgi:hypothetical protein
MLTQFDENSAARIGRVVRTVEAQYPRARPLAFGGVFGGGLDLGEPVGEEGGGGGGGGGTVRLGKTTGQWSKGTLATITLYEGGVPPSETASSPPETLEQCVNKFSNVESGKWVIVALGGNNAWYLIAAEC